MKILIEALGIDRTGGPRTATLDLIARLPEAAPDDDFHVLLTQREPSLVGIPRLHQIIGGPDRPMAQRIWLESVIWRIVRRVQPDLVHHVKGLGTLIRPVPYILTMHDLGFLEAPDLFPAIDRAYWKYVQPPIVRRARRIVAVSEDTKADTVKWYSVPPDRVDVVHNSVGPAFHPRTLEEITPAMDRFGLVPGYVLHVGSISLKKNLTPLVQAVSSLRAAGRDLKLVLVGRHYHKAPDPALAEASAALDRDGGLVSLGVVSDEDLPLVYAGAGVFVFPSLFEGFGIAPVEAARCGVPVIAAPLNGMEEALGDACYQLKNPKDPQEVAAAITTVLDDSALSADLVRRGLVHTTRFTFEAAATRLAETYRKAANPTPSTSSG